MLMSFIRDESGGAVVEAALIVLLMSIVSYMGYTTLGQSVATMASQANTGLQTQPSQ